MVVHRIARQTILPHSLISLLIGFKIVLRSITVDDVRKLRVWLHKDWSTIENTDVLYNL